MSGRIFLFGDDIDTDQLAPGRYMRGGIDELAAHCLESVRPEFPSTARPGDIIVAGRNFGMGSSREQAPEALKRLGIAGVVALSFAGIFYRNAINLGLPVLVASDISIVENGDCGELDVEAAQLRLPEKKEIVELEKLPEYLQVLLSDGGLVPHLKKNLALQRAGART